MTSPNMGLTVPVPGVTPSYPQNPSDNYATQISSDLGIIDAHDHSAGHGAPLAASAIPDANPTTRGVVSIGPQTFGGAKVFQDGVSGSNLSGTNSGDVSLAAVGAAPTANGASLVGQALTLQPADGTHPGVVTAGAQTIGGVKTLTTPLAQSLDVPSTGTLALGGTNATEVDLGSAAVLVKALQNLAAVGDIYAANWLNDLNLRGNVLFKRVTNPASAPSPALAGLGAGLLSNGVYKYKVTFVSPSGETQASAASATVTVVDHTTNGQVALTSIPTSSNSRVTARKLYRTVHDGATYLLLATIANNIAAVYTDNIADASLGASEPALNLSGGCLLGTAPDAANAIGFKIGNDIALTAAGALIQAWYSDLLTTQVASINKDGALKLAANVLGQRDAKVTLTPTNGSTVTIDYNASNTVLIDASALVTGNSYTIAISNLPSASYVPALTIVIKTGATLPTLNWFSGVTAPTLSVSVENWLTMCSLDAGTTWRTFQAGTF